MNDLEIDKNIIYNLFKNYIKCIKINRYIRYIYLTK